jgi:Domain of unknown function (DUF4129)
VRLETLAVRLRPRTPFEAADLGVRLCQATLRSVYLCHGIVAIPLLILAIASYQIAAWLPGLLIWWAKPWLDRTILFVLSRAAFGVATGPLDVWRAQRQVWWRQFLLTWTVRRLSPWRSLTEPVYQLEGFSIFKSSPRIKQIRGRTMAAAAMMTGAFNLCELALSFALFSLVFWLAPVDRTPGLDEIFAGEVPLLLKLSLPVSYAMTVLFLEPFYVAAGFGMYLNRRAELEAWDIEQEFRRAFSVKASIAAAMLAAILLGTAVPALAAQPISRGVSTAPDRGAIDRAIESVKADPNLATERTIKTLRWKGSMQHGPMKLPGWLSWLGAFFGWIAESTRVLVWCGALGLAALVVVYLLRIARTQLAESEDAAFVAPTHVRDLDIRPESLPDDVGAAARQLWERGEQRAALALLYRGMLSRLAHVHRVPIRDSSTEGDCVALAIAQLPAGSDYVARLVKVWQRLGYGHETVDSAAVYGLCDEFDATLRRSAA